LPAESGPDDPEPTWHQVAELPPLAARITEHQGHARTCPGCGEVTRASIPAEVRAHSIDPRLAAVMTYLRGAHHVSMRGVEEIVETVFEVPVALGKVAQLEQEMSQALAAPHAAAVQAVQEAPVKHVDETSWKQSGKRCWLWVAATAALAVFRIHRRRSRAGLTALLGQVIQGIVCSDRWSVYGKLPACQRQVCWAHLKRDFRKCADRGGVGALVGRAGLAVVQEVFACWHRYRDGPGDRGRLLHELDPLAAALGEILEAGQQCADGEVAGFCGKLQAVERALWTFAVVEGVEPTNNHAERVLRRGVLWRKCAFGSQSEGGCQFVERMLTAVQSLRLQKRAVLAYLYEALVAHRKGLPAPSLLPAG
jgi:transposase